MFCPVCNGIQPLRGSCPACNGMVTDFGRLADLAGPYAPYVQIVNEQQLSGADSEDAAVGCKHVLYCPVCRQTTEVSVTEWQ
ncbi:hypothetical protein [Paenibacillus arenilitoris]|uniref:Uncharacterized protein n=1 Tax=Paenibacillus arenilitoris TaxID=2772299 RepID=A0A927CHD6_9BACL|nr:hypothetical protein [Paenibacillus arenilitoris]MBD2868124.1 hypothetical protein [Paenibacillus arenilitoris]